MATIECGTSGGGEDDVDNGPRRLALHNPVILQQIFSHLDTKTLKTVREVCKMWEAEGTVFLGKQCYFHLHRIYNDYYKTTDKLTAMAETVNHKLLKSIYIDNYMFDGTPKLFFDSFVSMWHPDVQEIALINVDVGKDICAGLPAALNDGFPNLTKMTIRKLMGSDFDWNMSLRSINTLKEIEIVGVRFLMGHSYPQLQNLINSAPNLECLHIEGNFYPKLDACGKIKVLKWLGIQNRDLLGPAYRPIRLHEMFRMINEVGDSLEHLTLGLCVIIPHDAFSDLEEFDLYFPILRKLKSLTLNKVDLLNVVEQICPSLFPKLEIVSFQDGYVHKASRILDLTHHGVTSLELQGVNEPKLITGASRKFPNVNRLVINIDVPPLVDLTGEDLTEDDVLGSILQACSTWKLDHLEVKMGNMKLSQVLRGLKSLRLLEGIKEVWIVQGEKCLTDDNDDLDDDFKEVLQLGSEINRMIFKGLLLKATTKEQVLEFLKNHKDLPVFFFDCA